MHFFALYNVVMKWSIEVLNFPTEVLIEDLYAHMDRSFFAEKLFPFCYLSPLGTTSSTSSWSKWTTLIANGILPSPGCWWCCGCCCFIELFHLYFCEYVHITHMNNIFLRSHEVSGCHDVNVVPFIPWNSFMTNKNSETSTLGEHTCLIFQFSTYLLKYTAYVRGVSLFPLPKMGVPLPAILSVRQSTSPSYADFYGCSLGL